MIKKSKAKLNEVKPVEAKPTAIMPVEARPLEAKTIGVKVEMKPPAVRLELVKPGVKAVSVAGSFNSWVPDRTPMMSMGNGRWVKELAVGPGRYEYLFVADGQWLPDPNAKESVQNPFGGKNSVLIIPA